MCIRSNSPVKKKWINQISIQTHDCTCTVTGDISSSVIKIFIEVLLTLLSLLIAKLELVLDSWSEWPPRSRPALRSMTLCYSYWINLTMYNVLKALCLHLYPFLCRNNFYIHKGIWHFRWRGQPCKGLEVEMSLWWPGDVYGTQFLQSFAHLGFLGGTRIREQPSSTLCGLSLGPESEDDSVNAGIHTRGLGVNWSKVRLYGSMLIVCSLEAHEHSI